MARMQILVEEHQKAWVEKESYLTKKSESEIMRNLIQEKIDEEKSPRD